MTTCGHRLTAPLRVRKAPLLQAARVALKILDNITFNRVRCGGEGHEALLQ